MVATAADQHDGLRAVGVDVAEVGPSHEENNRRVAEIMPELRAVPTSERRAIAFSLAFGKQYAPNVADDLFALARSWRADAVLAGLESLAGPLVAARLARPLIVSGFGIGLSTSVPMSSVGYCMYGRANTLPQTVTCPICGSACTVERAVACHRPYTRGRALWDRAPCEDSSAQWHGEIARLRHEHAGTISPRVRALISLDIHDLLWCARARRRSRRTRTSARA